MWPLLMTAMTLGQRSPYPRAPLAGRQSGVQRRRPPRPSVRAHSDSRPRGPLDRRTHTPGAEGVLWGSFQTWGRSGQRQVPGSDLGRGALQAVLGDCDDVGGQDAAEDVEVQEIGLLSAGGRTGTCQGLARCRGRRDGGPRLQAARLAAGLSRGSESPKISSHSAPQTAQTALS